MRAACREMWDIGYRISGGAANTVRRQKKGNGRVQGPDAKYQSRRAEAEFLDVIGSYEFSALLFSHLY
jgi:hypothetical protein